MPIVKCKRKKLRELLNKKESDVLENSQLIQIMKDTKMKRFILRKIYSRTKLIVARQSFANNLRQVKKKNSVTHRFFYGEKKCVTHSTSQSSKQKSRMGMAFSKKNVWRNLLSDGVNPHNMHGTTARFLRSWYQNNTASSDW